MNKRTVSVVLSATLIMACAIVRPPATATPSAIPSSATPSKTASPMASLQGCLHVSGTVRLRREPSTQAEIITRIPPASCFPVYGYNAEHTWVRVRLGDQDGWAAAQYVTIQGDASQLPVLVAGTDKGMVVTMQPTSTTTPTSTRTVTPTRTVAPASTATRTLAPTPTATTTVGPPPTTAPTGTPTALSIPTPTDLLCSSTSAYTGRKVTCKIPFAFCSYYPALAGSPTYCTDAPLPNYGFALLVWGQDWSDYAGTCMVITGVVSLNQNKPQIVATDRSQISSCP